MEIPSCGDSTWMTMIRIVALWHPLLFGFIYLFPLFLFVVDAILFCFRVVFSFNLVTRAVCVYIVECSWRFPRWLSPTDSINRYRLSLSLLRVSTAPSPLCRFNGFRFPFSWSDSAAAHSGILRGNDNVITQHQRRIFLLYSPPYISSLQWSCSAQRKIKWLLVVTHIDTPSIAFSHPFD
jgi:hypothetical protein